MISLAVLATGIMAIIGHIGTLKLARDSAYDISVIDNLASELTDRIQGGRWEVLGAPGAAWTLPRPFTGALPGHNPPMTDTAANSQDNLVSIGLLRRKTFIPNLKVYVDYYRAVTSYDDAGVVIPGQEGLMDGEKNTYTQVSPIWKNESSLTPFLLDPGSIPTTLVGVSDPIIIRITITSDILVRPIKLFLARKA